MDARAPMPDKRVRFHHPHEARMHNVERTAWRRRHWLSFCVSALVAACGGGGEASGTAVWDAGAGWDNMTWN